MKYGISGGLLLLLVMASMLLPGQRQSAARDPGTGVISPLPMPVNVRGSVSGGPLQKQAVINIVLLSPSGDSLASGREQELLSRFVALENLQQKWTVVKDIPSLVATLSARGADIVASMDEGLLDKLQGQVLHTLPWAVSKQQVIGRTSSNGDISLDGLAVRQLAVKRSSPSWQKLMNMAEDYQTMELLEIPESESVSTTLERVSSGQYDLAVLDSLSLPADLDFHYNLEAILDLSDESYMTWGVNPKSQTLHKSLNKFLSRDHLESGIGRSYRDDLQGIRQRNVLRLITYQSPVNYYYERGRFKGFEYELVRRFAEQNGLRLDVVIADNYEQMIELLNDGKGDIIAASVPESRYGNTGGVKVSSAYNYASPVLVGREDDKIVDVRDLQGRTIHIPPESPYLKVLNRIKSEGIDFTIIVAGTEQNTESILFGLAQGVYDLSVISSHELKAELSRQLNVQAKFQLGDPAPLVWAVRETNTQLLSALNDYIAAEYRKGFYNVVYTRYIDKPEARISDSRLFASLDQLSPYDEVVHKYADHYGFDWRLIVAQIYQESRFNPQAVSEAGAEGLMQLLPKTSEMVGVTDPYNPENNIGGGVYYLDYIRGLFEEGLSVEERTWFTLASYNAGYYRVKQARDLAESMGLDRDRWFDNVETAMLRLARPYSNKGVATRKCRCGETAAYVREIRTLYNNYLRLTQSVKAVSRIVPEVDES